MTLPNRLNLYRRAVKLWGAVERERARKLERLRERVDHAESVARPVAPCDGSG